MNGLSNYFGGVSSGVSKYFGSSTGIVEEASWEIDPVNGSDSASGRPGYPLADFAGFSAATRGQTFAQDTTLTVLSDTDENVALAPNLANGALLYVRATPTVFYSGALTSGTIAWDNSTHQEVIAAASGLPTSFTASDLLNRMVRIASGARAGNTTWIGKDLGSKTARCPGWIDPFYDLATGPSGDSFEALTLVRLSGTWSVAARGQGFVWFQDIEVGGRGSPHHLEISSGAALAARCRLNGVDVSRPASFNVTGCAVVDGFYVNGLATIDRCLVSRPGNTALGVLPGGSMAIYDQCLAESYGLSMWETSQLSIEGSVSFCDNTRGATLMPGALVMQTGYCWFRETLQAGQVFFNYPGTTWTYASGRASANYGSTTPGLGTLGGTTITALPQTNANALANIVVMQ